MKAVDLLPQVLWALAVVAHVYSILKHGIQKETLPMSEGLDTITAPVQTLAPPPPPAPDAPMSTAPADQQTAATPAPAVNSTAVVNSVVQTVTSHPDVPQSKAAGIIASLLAGLYQAEPAIFAVTRSSEKTQTEVGLGLGLAEIIVGAFLHPTGA